MKPKDAQGRMYSDRQTDSLAHRACKESYGAMLPTASLRASEFKVVCRERARPQLSKGGRGEQREEGGRERD